MGDGVGNARVGDGVDGTGVGDGVADGAGESCAWVAAVGGPYAGRIAVLVDMLRQAVDSVLAKKLDDPRADIDRRTRAQRRRTTR